MAHAFAAPPRGGMEPARPPDAAHGPRAAQRNERPEAAASARRMEAGSFGERIAEARRDAERESTRRMQARNRQTAGDRAGPGAPGIATGRPADTESRPTSAHDPEDARNATALDAGAADDGSASAALHAAAPAAPDATSTASDRAETPVSSSVSGAATRAATAAAIAARVSSGAAGIGSAVQPGDDIEADSSVAGTAGDGVLAQDPGEDVNVGGDADFGVERATEHPDSAAAATILAERDAARPGARDGATDRDPAGLASRLPQAADNASIGAAGLAPAASTASAVPYAGNSALAGPGPTYIGGIATPLPDSAFAGHLAGETLKLAISGIERAEISVQPKDLGPIRIELSLNGESARIAFTATQPETRQAIEQSLPILEGMLAEHGLLLSDADVSERRGDGGAGNHAEKASDSGRGPASERRSGATGESPGSRSADGMARGHAIRRGLVDLYA